MNRTGLTRIAVSFSLLLSCAVCGPAQAQPKPADAAVKPSENKGKTGKYEVKTSKTGYNYHVYVPKNYSDDNPAGIHIYFHGQNGQSGASYFGNWAKHFLDPHNLIGINMQYMDGDNAKDTGGKMAAAREAIAQVMADYKIIPGRGVISSFSGGGLPHAEFMTQCGKQGKTAYPFNHTAIYDSNFWINAAGGPPMSWFIALGEKEWNAGSPTLGTTQPAKFYELLAAGFVDTYMKVTKDKGHTIADKDVEDSARLFHVSDIVMAPFIYAPDYAQKELAPIAALANNLELGKATAAIEKLLKDPKLKDDVKQNAEKLKQLLDKRADEKIELMKQLGQDDPPLFAYYLKKIEPQFAGHPKLADLKQVVTEVQKTDQYKAALNAYTAFAKLAPTCFSGPKLNASAAAALEKLKDSAPENSFFGKMIREFLELK
ncbi:MAG: hypothetical protein HZA50_08855 [Planctomycetes bacterium]|nr:hypothetical protein [Planctomycetota bacterium]